MNYVITVEATTLMKISMEQFGTIDAVFDIAKTNYIDLTSVIPDGEKVYLPSKRYLRPIEYTPRKTNKDILLDGDYELMVETGDFVLGDPELQEVQILLMLNNNSLVEFPDLGTNLVNQIKSKDKRKVLKSIRVSLLKDGKNFEDYKEKISINE